MSGPFRLRIATSTTRATAGITNVYAIRGDHEQVLRFYGGPIRDDLEKKAGAFAEALSEFAGRSWTPNCGTLPPQDRLTSLQASAQGLYRGLFRHANPAREAAEREELRFFLDHPNLRYITFDSDVAGIPLDALHYGDPGSPLDLDRFIGARAPVIHAPRPHREERETDYDTPSVGLLGSTTVTSVSMRGPASIFAVFEELEAAGTCMVVEHTPLVGPDEKTPMAVADLDSLYRTLGNPRSVWHVTSHMEVFGNDHYFRLDNNLQVQANFFRFDVAGGRRLAGEPLMFLNICTSANTGVAADGSFPDNLLEMGAGGVIATHCLVNVRFATEFARRFYRYAFGGPVGVGDRLSVARSLHSARLDSLRDDASLASLCYSFHALEDFDLPASERLTVTVPVEGGAHAAA